MRTHAHPLLCLPHHPLRPPCFASAQHGTVFIDGNYEHVPYDSPRSVAIYANHSRTPNASVQHWPMRAAPPLGLRDRMWIIALEPIAAGGEIRIDYEGGGASYWGAMGVQPTEGPWRTVRVPTPPPSGDEPVINYLEANQRASGDLPLPRERSVDGGAPMPWHGAQAGDARLRWLLPLLESCRRGDAGHEDKVPWDLVATHVPGRSAAECRSRWRDIGPEIQGPV